MKRADETVLPAEWLIPTAKPVIRWHKINIPLFKTLSFILFRWKICMEYIESTLLALHHPGDEMFIGNSLNQSNWVLNVAPSIVNHSTNPSTMPVTVGGEWVFKLRIPWNQIPAELADIVKAINLQVPIKYCLRTLHGTLVIVVC